MTWTDKDLQAPVTLCSRTTAVKSTPIKSLRFLVVYTPLTGTRFGIRGILNAVPPVLALKSHLSYPDAASEGWNRCRQILCQSAACAQWCNTHAQSRMLNWLYIWASFHHCKLWMNFWATHPKPIYSDLCTGYLDGIRCFALWGGLTVTEKICNILITGWLSHTLVQFTVSDRCAMLIICRFQTIMVPLSLSHTA